MSDRTELDLPRRPFPHLAPEPGGFESAMGRARVRRRRKLMETGTALGLVGVLAVGVSLRDPVRTQGGVDIARPNERIADPRDDGRTVDDLDSRPTGGPTQAPPPPYPGNGGPVAPRRPSSGGGPAVVPQPQGTRPQAKPPEPPRDAERPVPQPKRPIEGDTTDPQVDSEGAAACVQENATTTDAAGIWCLTALAEYQEVPGNIEAPSYRLSLRACRSLGSGVLHFDTVQRVDFQVRRGSQAVWTWSKGQSFPVRYQGTQFAAGECVTWSTGWDHEDEEGYLLEEGEYTLVAWTAARGMRQVTASDSFTVS